MKRTAIILGLGVAVLGLSGCVERLITVTSEPAGALVWLNGEEAGTTPLTRSFLWYGNYEVVLRKDGYETIRTARETKTPIYQWPGLDLIFENVLPWEFLDHHEWDFQLAPQQPTDPACLIERARKFRAAALAGE